MKKPVVDYRQFRLSRLNDPQFAHLKYWLTWLIYFALYFLTENLIPVEKCHPIHSVLDDMIPFNEYFVFFYVGWYFLVFGALAYTFFYDVDGFRHMQKFIIITQVIAMTCYVLYPSRQDLRPEVFPRENALTSLMAFIYSFDTSTGVCPSLHVGYSIGILSVGLKDRQLGTGWKLALSLFVLMVCVAVCFVKQHSAVDVLVALPMCLLAEILVYGRDYWKPRLFERHA